MDLVGEKMLAFREELLKSEPVSSLKNLKKQITPPEGVHRSTNQTTMMILFQMKVMSYMMGMGRTWKKKVMKFWKRIL